MTPPPAQTSPVYQDPNIYPDEKEDLKTLAYTWNFLDKRPPNHIYPLLPPVPLEHFEALRNPAQALFLT